MKKTKRLLHISTLIFPGFKGSGFNVRGWAELAKGFDELHIIARGADNRFKTEKNGNIYLHLMPRLGRSSIFGLLTLPYLFILIKKVKITHLLCQSAIFGGFYAIWAARLYNIPVFVEIHGEEYFRYLGSQKKRHTFLKSLISFVFHNATKIRSLNPLMTKKLVDSGFSKNIVEIPNRVDLQIFSPPKLSFKISERVKLISVGRFVKEKNYSALIQALAASNLSFDLCLIGGGPLKEEYCRLIDHYALHDRVQLIDWLDQSELVNRQTSADIYIQFSSSEGMPRSILEAMALKMPIITTNVGSIEGIVVDGTNGIVIHNNFEENLVKAIKLLCADQALRIRIATQAYQDILEKYEWNKMYERYRSELLNMNLK